METDRPMNEYEGALFDAVLPIGQTLLESGSISESALLNKLAEARTDSEEWGRRNEAATLGLLIKFLGESPRHFAAGDDPPR
jgi:hypothetical protein